MRIDILTLFPEMFLGPFSFSVFQRAVERGLVSVHTHQLREHTHDRHRTVDDAPYGGGAGMVLKPEPIFEGVAAIKTEIARDDTVTDGGLSNLPVILLSPRGRLFTQKIAFDLSRSRNLILICGRYEGVDERVAEHLATDDISVGDYVLSGGELAAMVIIDAVVRLIPGVLGKEESVWHDSHVGGLLQHPQYTRPPEYRGWEVPPVLLSGNHAEIARWRQEQALKLTTQRRPDLVHG